MPYWTLIYTPDPKNNPSASTELLVSFLTNSGDGTGWELSGGKHARRSLHVSELTFTADNVLFDSAPLFAYQSGVVVMRDRVRNVDGTFTGGTIYFQGVVTGIRRRARVSEAVEYTFSCPWWYLTKTVFEQTIWNGYVTSHVLLNMNPTTALKVDLGTQMTAILDYALGKVGWAAFSYDLSGLPAITPPSDELRDTTCAEAVKSEMRWVSSATSWVDHSQQPPVIRFLNRTAMSATSIALGDGVTITSADITPLYDLRVPQCHFRYEQTNKVGDTESFSLTDDIYPSASDNGSNLGILRATVNLQGFTASEQVAPLATLLINEYDPVSWGLFWAEKHPFLLDAQDLVLHDGVFVDSAGDPIDVSEMPYEVLHNGTIHRWMTLSDGTPVIHEDVTVKVLADYTDQYGNVVTDEEITSRIKMTNAPTADYIREKVTAWAEPIPVGLAQSFYQILSILQWDGRITVETSAGEVSAQQFLGCVLNLTGGLSDWATMNALVTDVTEDLEEGTVVVAFGANRYVSPGELVDLMRVTRSRLWTYYTTTATSGYTGQTDVLMPSAVARENSGRGNRENNKFVISYQDPTETGFGKNTATIDTLNKILTLADANPAGGLLQLSLSDLVANDALNP